MEENIKGLIHLYVTMFLYFFGGSVVVSSITDVTMSAVCPGKDECSYAIYLSGIHQAILGIGMVVVTPVMGNLSDKYGRKTLLSIPVTLNIIPPAILAYSRSTNFYYAHYVIKTITGMISDGSTSCLALAYVADNVPVEGRASAFGILSGVLSACFVCGNFASRFLSTDQTFQVAVLASMAAAVYMRIFLKESLPVDHRQHGLTKTLLKPEHDIEKISAPPQKTNASKKVSVVKDLICLVKSSKTFSQAAIASFFHSLGDAGYQATLMYFLKARFQFNKDQFSYIMLITGVASSICQLFFMPLLAPIFGAETLLSFGLFVATINMVICSVSWSAWVPYMISGFSVFSMFSYPTVRSIASKQVGPDEQGKVQGCLSGLSSLATIISPLIFSPLTALFLSDGAPFYFPGFSMFCAALATAISFIQSTMIKPVPSITSEQLS